MRQNLLYIANASGSYGREACQAGRQNACRFRIPYRLNYVFAQCYSIVVPIHLTSLVNQTAFLGVALTN